MYRAPEWQQVFYRVHPDRVDRLVLADTYAGWRGSFPQSVCQQRLEVFAEGVSPASSS